MRRIFHHIGKRKVRTDTMKNAQKYSTPWAVIKLAYEGGVGSARAIAKAYGVTEGAIRKRAKREGWRKRAKREGWARAPGTHKGTRPSVRSQVRTTPYDDRKNENPRSQEPAPTRQVFSKLTREPVDLSVLRRQGFELIATLTRELQIYSDNVGLIEEIILEETAGDRSPRRRDMLLKAISTSSRMSSAKNMAAAFDILYGAGPGKKDEAKEAAKNVGGGDSPWGDDLDPYSSDGKKPN